MDPRVKAYFDAIAPQWDEIRHGFYSEQVIRRAVSLAGLTPGLAVADVGTGTGFVAASLAGMAREVVGIDGSARMLEIARQNLAALGLANVRLLPGDVAALPLDDGCVDVAFANMVLHHAPEPPAMLREMARIVRLGGTVVITDAEAHPYDWFRSEMADLWLGFGQSQIKGWLRDAGLADVHRRSVGAQ